MDYRFLAGARDYVITALLCVAIYAQMAFPWRRTDYLRPQDFGMDRPSTHHRVHRSDPINPDQGPAGGDHRAQGPERPAALRIGRLKGFFIKQAGIEPAALEAARTEAINLYESRTKTPVTTDDPIVWIGDVIVKQRES